MSDAVGPDVSNDSPEPRQRLVASRSSRGGHRYSIGSTETGESSTQNSLSEAPLIEPSPNTTETQANRLDGRRAHRSHKSRGSGGFLLSSTLPEQSIGTERGLEPYESNGRRPAPSRENKGKIVIHNHERRNTKKQPKKGLAISGSPLAANVTNAGIERDINGSRIGGEDTRGPGIKVLDADSAQMVNLALNLSESRKVAARRNVSAPLPPIAQAFGDNFAGGSLRQYLQQQRRSSRNVSPKPDRGGSTVSPRVSQGDRLNGSFQAGFLENQDADYHYQFSPSTLARAENAKKAIELMAQYRRLLQYVPPLKPQRSTIAIASSPPSTATGSPTNPAFPISRTVSAVAPSRPLGRAYNPLQYIRNRKVRARERKMIDGEDQGFGDVAKVTSWVDRVSQDSVNEGYQNGDRILLPSLTTDPAKDISTQASPGSSSRTQTTSNKVKRPRIDWITNPADMLADVLWLEDNDNKKMIEDNRERKIFPQNFQVVRPQSPKVESSTKPDTKPEVPNPTLRLDTKLPAFNPLRHQAHHNNDSPGGKFRKKLHDAANFPEEMNRYGHEHHLLFSPNRYTSDSSDSDSGPRRRRQRSATTESNDLNRDILEKQMLEILAKETNGSDNWISKSETDGSKVIQSIESPYQGQQIDTGSPDARSEGNIRQQSSPTEAKKHRRTDSLKPSGLSPGSSKRGSLEVPGYRDRSSLDGLDSTAPNSPQTKASNIKNSFIPSIAMDLSPPHSRRNSPSRKPALARVRSKINNFRGDRSREPSRDRFIRGENLGIEDKPEPASPISRQRSPSPTKKVVSSRTGDSLKSTSSKAGSIRRRDDEMSGIRGLFKGGRNQVSKVSDMFWKKEQTSSALPSSSSSDDSGPEDDLGDQDGGNSNFQNSFSAAPSLDNDLEVSPFTEHKSYLSEMPTFVSSREDRGRSTRAQATDDDSPKYRSASECHKAREQRRKSHLTLLKPPRIDIQNPSRSSSVDGAHRSSQNSDVSDLGSRRPSDASAVQGADARLNAILGLPGSIIRPDNYGLPVTGLSHLDNRRPSMDSRMGSRQWSISEREVMAHTAPMFKYEIARVRTLLLSSGIKAREISRRAGELRDLRDKNASRFSDVLDLNTDEQLLQPIPRSQEHVLAARILSNDIQLSSRVWQDSVDKFSSQTVGGLLDRVEDLQDRLTGRNGLSEMGRVAADEADEVSRDLITGQTLKVKKLVETMDTMMRRRRRRLRWVRRGGWVILEWTLVGVMWLVWLVVMFIRVIRGIVNGAVSSVRWLLWL